MTYETLTTTTLLKRKSELEYCAQMCALETMEVPEAVAEEYTSLNEELSGRDQLYRSGCTREGLEEALVDWLEVVKANDTADLLERLGRGFEVNEETDCYRLNPRNPFFREIGVYVAPRDEASTKVIYATFAPSLAFPLVWLTDNLPNITPRADVPVEAESRYETLQVSGARTGRIEFWVLNTDAGGLVYSILVQCF